MANINAGPFTTRPVIDGTFGVIASTHWISTAVGMGVLERGGNAFDAGLAAIFTLQVVEPHLNGPGGEVPIILHDARADRTTVICGQGTAPAAATIDRFRSDLGLETIPGSGLLAATVPSAFQTYMHVLEQYGTWPLEDVLEAAIGYAAQGFPLVERAAAMIGTVDSLFRDHWHTSAEIYLPNDTIPQPGALFRNPQMAAMYARLLSEAKAGGGSRETQIRRATDVWSQGFVAEAIDRFCRDEPAFDVTGRPNAGLLSGDDIARWKPTEEAPLGFAFGDHEVLKAGPWTQGPVLLQQLALLANFDLLAMSPTDADFIHLWTECAKLAYADRDAFYGDPDFVDVPMETLLSRDYNVARAAQVDVDRASMELRPGTIDGFGGQIRVGDAALAPDGFGVGEPTVGRLGTVRGDTVHVDVIDGDGNMFSATPSGGWFQSSPVIRGLGFPLGTRAQMFWLDEDTPAALAPGKRPRTTLSVSMAKRDGRPELIWGTPGGDSQDQWNAQVFLKHAAFGLDLQEAIDAPAWHSEHAPSSFFPRAARPGVLVVEDRVGADVIAELQKRGHIVEVAPSWSEGRLSMASHRNGRLRAAANARGMQGYAAGR